MEFRAEVPQQEFDELQRRLDTARWPDHLDVIEALAEDFTVVVPTMPGFGFSGVTTTSGWGVERIARAWIALMEQLGFPRYGVHGYDWGARIGPALARIVPERVIGLHLDGYFVFPQGEELTEAEQHRLSGLDRWQHERSGYATIQSTRPQTLTYSLLDSPIGQLAWKVPSATIRSSTPSH